MLLIDSFKEINDLIISTKHIDDNEDSIIYSGGKNSEIYEEIRENSDYILEKFKPNAFLDTDLQEILENNNINKLYIVGYNNGYTYEINDLDIVDFIGSILHWSDSMEVLYYDEIEINNKL